MFFIGQKTVNSFLSLETGERCTSWYCERFVTCRPQTKLVGESLKDLKLFLQGKSSVAKG